jgi:hypothetical protein
MLQQWKDKVRKHRRPCAASAGHLAIYPAYSGRGGTGIPPEGEITATGPQTQLHHGSRHCLDLAPFKFMVIPAAGASRRVKRCDLIQHTFPGFSEADRESIYLQEITPLYDD